MQSVRQAVKGLKQMLRKIGPLVWTVRRVRQAANVACGKDLYVRRDLRRKTERVGSESGAWDILADQIHKDSVVYSVGIGTEMSFDLGMIARFGVVVHGFDPTPMSIDWVRAQPIPPEFVLHEYGVAAADGQITFYPPETSDQVSHTLLQRPSANDTAINVPVKSLETIMTELGHKRIDVLRMNIEGAEYQVIDSLAAGGTRPGQILVSFHHRFPEVGVEKTRQAIARLRKMGYRLFAISDWAGYSFVWEADRADRATGDRDK